MWRGRPIGGYRVYERANMLATFGNVDRWRREAVALFYSLDGMAALKVLDAGAGPGNMARHLRGIRYVVALDAGAGDAVC